MIHIRNYDKNNAYTIMRLYIMCNTTGNIIKIMVMGDGNSIMTTDMLPPPININTKTIKRL